VCCQCYGMKGGGGSGRGTETMVGVGGVAD
jgi:hypothetical protein